MKLLMPYHNILNRIFREKKLLSWEYQDLALIVIFINTSFKVECFKIKDGYLISLATSSHLQNSHLTLAASIFGHHLR